jgi:uncharacterized protein
VVAHDVFHLKRVARTARLIYEHEGGDLTTILAAAHLHDYHRLIEKNIGRHISPDEVEREVLEILERIEEIPPSLHPKICEAINYTEVFRFAGDNLGQRLPSIECKIVRDADMLDALGAVGIARAFMFGGFLGEPMWLPGSGSLSPAKKFIPGKTSSVIDHFHEKLFRLEAEMETAYGRQLAKERSAFMRHFIDQLMTEMEH